MTKYFGLWNKIHNNWCFNNGVVIWYPLKVIADTHAATLNGMFGTKSEYYQWEVREFV